MLLDELLGFLITVRTNVGKKGNVASEELNILGLNHLF
jgi:hypothetical protein